MPTLSRVMSGATAAYGVFALVRPSHLPQALGADADEHAALELLTRVLGVRDLAVSALGVAGSPALVRAAMGLRIAFDVGDGALLALRTTDPDVRRKVLAVTMGWAALNTLAVAVDAARS